VATLLLADDSITTQKVVKLTFADEGIHVITADDGDTALRLFEAHRPDIILADVNMPGLNGYEVCEAVRKVSDQVSTPVVLLVGSFEPFDPQNAHRVGANDYLTKPFASIRRLVATVLGLLEAKGPKADAELVATQEPQPDIDHNITAANEPDMTATDDIENLYSESFAETVEMPHTVAARFAIDDGSADDELIETKFTAPAAEPAKDQAEYEPAPLAESQAAEEVAINESHPAAEYERQDTAEPLDGEKGFEFEQPVADGFDTEAELAPPPAAVEEPSPHAAPTEEFQFDNPNGEAYFTPAGDSLRNIPVDIEASEPARNGGSDPAEEAVSQQRLPTPWDSVATPSERSFQFDETNLLELPGEPGRLEADDREQSQNESNSTEHISAETVERIARIVASQMSEQLINEIAERIVPRVVEETIARRRAEEVNQ